jgi:hypothetical protein
LCCARAAASTRSQQPLTACLAPRRGRRRCLRRWGPRWWTTAWQVGMHAVQGLAARGRRGSAAHAAEAACQARPRPSPLASAPPRRCRHQLQPLCLRPDGRRQNAHHHGAGGEGRGGRPGRQLRPHAARLHPALPPHRAGGGGARALHREVLVSRAQIGMGGVGVGVGDTTLLGPGAAARGGRHSCADAPGRL